MSADASLWFEGGRLDAGGCFVGLAEPIERTLKRHNTHKSMVQSVVLKENKSDDGDEYAGAPPERAGSEGENRCGKPAEHGP